MDFHNLSDYFKLSAQLNLQLSATAVGRSNILSIILGRRPPPAIDRVVLLRALGYIADAYGERRRRIGPLAVLHPLRATALLARAHDVPTTLDLLTSLLHDKLEDITPDDVGAERHAELEVTFAELVHAIDPRDEWYLMERLEWLTRRPDMSYYAYVGRLLDHSVDVPSIVAVKLADRLDNTLDLRIAVEDPIEEIDFFELLFQVLFVNHFKGHEPDLPHPPASPLRSAQRLHQLFKNVVLLSLIRRRGTGFASPGEERLFDAVAIASMKEAQRTALHAIGYHLTDVATQRKLLTDVMGYAQAGGADRVTRVSAGSTLDGLFEQTFDARDPKVRAKRLEDLNGDKERLFRAAVIFIVVFQNFRIDPTYRVDGVSSEGITHLP
jgi:hypothetical protein